MWFTGMVGENAYVDVSTLFPGILVGSPAPVGWCQFPPRTVFRPLFFLVILLVHRPFSSLVIFSFISSSLFPRHIKEREKELKNSEPFWNVEYTRQQRLWPLKVRWTMVLASFSAAALCFCPFLAPFHPFPSTLQFSCIVLSVAGLFYFVVPGSFEHGVYHSEDRRRFGFFEIFFLSLSLLVQAVGFSR